VSSIGPNPRDETIQQALTLCGDGVSQESPTLSIKDNTTLSPPAAGSSVRPALRRIVRGKDPASPLAEGEFELGTVLGRGGMEIVYSARQVSLDREIAVKMMRPEDEELISNRFSGGAGICA